MLGKKCSGNRFCYGRFVQRMSAINEKYMRNDLYRECSNIICGALYDALNEDFVGELFYELEGCTLTDEDDDNVG